MRRQAYDICCCAAASAPTPAIARPVFRRVPAEDLADTVTGLLDGLADGSARATRASARSATASSDDELGLLAGREPAKSRAERR